MWKGPEGRETRGGEAEGMDTGFRKAREENSGKGGWLDDEICAQLMGGGSW